MILKINFLTDFIFNLIFLGFWGKKKSSVRKKYDNYFVCVYLMSQKNLFENHMSSFWRSVIFGRLVLFLFWSKFTMVSRFSSLIIWIRIFKNKFKFISKHFFLKHTLFLLLSIIFTINSNIFDRLLIKVGVTHHKGLKSESRLWTA